MLFYTLADEGIVGYKDMAAVDNGDRYLIGRSLRPVAVAYDPVDKVEKRAFDMALFDSAVFRMGFCACFVCVLLRD